MTRLVVRLAAAVLVTAAVGLGVPSAAQAATCSSSQGVSVVVDFHQLGGGVQTHCDRGGAGKTAWDQLEDVGYRLTGVQKQPGFVCRIDDKPSETQDACVTTPPADAYWSLWWSDGRSGKWAFSSTGAGSLKVPAGGYVAMSWQGGAGKAAPGASPTPHPTQPTSSPTTRAPTSPASSHAPGLTPSSSTTSSAPSTPSATTSPSAGPSRSAKRSTKAKTKAHHEPAKTDGPRAAGPVAGVSTGGPGSSGGSGSGGLPGWVAPVAIVVLFVGATAFVVARRKTSGGPG